MNDFVSKRWDPNSYQNCQLCTHPTSHRTMHWHKQEQNLTATIPFPWPKVRVTQLLPRSELQTQNHPPQEHQMIMHGTTATNKRVSSVEKMMMYSTSFYFEKELWTLANFTSLFLFFFSRHKKFPRTATRNLWRPAPETMPSLTCSVGHGVLLSKRALQSPPISAMAPHSLEAQRSSRSRPLLSLAWSWAPPTPQC